MEFLRQARRALLDAVGAAVRRRVAAAYDPFTAGRETPPPQETYAFLRWAFRGMERPLALMVACALGVGLVEVAIIDGVGRLVDIAATAPTEAFWSEADALLIWLAALILVLRPVVVLGQGAFTSLIVNPALSPSVISRLHAHALTQPVSFFDNDFAGRLSQKELQTGAAIQSITTDAVNAAGMLVAFLVGMTISLAAIEPWFGLATVAWTGLYAVALRAALPEIRGRAKTRAERRSVLSGQLVDSFANIKTVKLFAHGGRERVAADAALERYREAAVDVGVSIMRLRLSLAILNALLMLVAIGAPLLLWRSGEAGLGAMTASAMLAFRLTGMSNWIAFSLLGIFSELGTLEDGVRTLTKSPTIVDPEAPKPEDAIASNSVTFRDVAFDYALSRPSGARRLVAGLDGFDLDIAPGEKVGLVGPSGAGKSTAIALLLRLYDVTGGAVRVGGVDVRDLEQDALRRRIGVVTQETALFNRSARDNIRYGKPEASQAEIEAAARLATAHDFIAELEDRRGRRGYDAELGERGVRLSGGQRQRLAIARAFLKDAPILALDEATSALDSEAEAQVLGALRRLMAGKTVVAIAHRLSTVAEMDRIAVLDRGRVVELGPHHDLVAAGGLYARLWARQSGGFLGAETASAAE